MLTGWIIMTYFCVNFKFTATEEDCSPVYVRWARVRLNLTARVAGPYSLDNCTRSCSTGHNPARPSFPIECFGFNHKQGANSLSHDCQLFQREQLLNVDGHVEADDRYSFYWKYCAKTKKMCKAQYQFDFYIDRFMDSSEVQRTINTDKVEDCLSRCLDETSFTCRSVSFNRTANVCSLSSQSQVTKPGYLRVNNNPNYRIDYYENNCFNESFTFHHDCRDNGVVVSVESKFPYSGALYGLYDFFTCRIEPKDELRFSLFFPYSTYSKNCTDSFSQKENNNVLDVVLSTDGMEPLYFLTDQDMLYQAKCPMTSSVIAAAPSTVGATVVFLVPPSSSPPTTPVETSSSEQTTPSTAPYHVSDSPITSTISELSSASGTSSISTDRTTKTTTKEQSKNVESFKKPVYTLPVIDFTPETEKPDTNDSLPPRSGSKITVVINYPHNDHENVSDIDLTTSGLKEFTDKESSSSASATTGGIIKTWKGSWERTLDPSSSTITTTTATESHESSTDRLSTVLHETSTPYEKLPKLILIGDNDDYDSTKSAPFSSFSSTDSTPSSSKLEISSPPTVVSTTRSSSLSPSISTSATSSSTTSATTPTTSTSESSTSTTITTTETSSPSASTTKETTPNNQKTTTEYLISNTKEWYNSRFDPFGNIGKPINSDSTISLSFTSSTLETTIPSTTTTTTATATAATTTTTTTIATKSTTFGKNFDKFSTTSSIGALSRSSAASITSSSINPSTLTNKSSGSSFNSTAANVLHTTTPPQKVLFDIYHNNQPVNAVVVGSRIILTFTPGLGVPAAYISLIGCQVEPVNSPYSWEKDSLQIVKNGCQADGVGLVCPPARTDYGIKIEMEAFRYTTTSEVLYSCLVRICAFNPCPQPFCNPVDGCYAPTNAALPVLINNPGLINSPSFNNPGLINNAGFNNPGLINNPAINNPGLINSPGLLGSPGRRKRQQRPSPFLPLVPSFQVPGAFQQNLLGSAGDILVSKKLVVVNSDIELQYYLRTGNVPTNNNFNGLLGR